MFAFKISKWSRSTKILAISIIGSVFLIFNSGSALSIEAMSNRYEAQNQYCKNLAPIKFDANAEYTPWQKKRIAQQHSNKKWCNAFSFGSSVNPVLQLGLYVFNIFPSEIESLETNI